MSKTQKCRLKKVLLDRRISLLRDFKSGMLKSMTRDVSGDFEAFRDEDDGTYSDHSGKIHSARLRAMKETIRNIEMALERLERGDYGVCAERRRHRPRKATDHSVRSSLQGLPGGERTPRKKKKLPEHI